MNRLLTAFFFFLILMLMLPLQYVFPQSELPNYKLSAHIVNEEGNAIEYGKALLIAALDSTVIQGKVITDGALQFNDFRTRNCLLKISAIGYVDHVQHLALSQPHTELGSIVLRAITMEGVEIMAARDLIQRKNGKWLVNVESSSLQNAGSILDVLRNTPQVFINSNNEISVVGKGNALIYLDGQLIPSNSVLQDLTSQDVKNIEIIENPSAKYDANGQALIHIHTKNKSQEGYKIGWVQEVGHGKHLRGNTNLNTYFRYSSLMVQAGYGYRPMTISAKNDYGRTYLHRGRQVDIDNQYDYSIGRMSHTYHFKAAYLLGQNSKIGLGYSGSLTAGDKEGLNRNVYDENRQNVFRMNTQIEGPFDQQSNTWQLNFEHKLDSLGSGFNISGQYADFGSGRLENIHQVLKRDSSNFAIDRRTINSSDIKVVSAQLDFNKKFFHKSALETGAKYAMISNHSLLNFEGLAEDGSWFLFSDLSTDYNYTEDIWAAYAQYGFLHRQWSLKAGARGEFVRTAGISISEKSQIPISRKYFNIFPSASLSRELSVHMDARLAYNYRIQRPVFQDLNPFTFYADSLVSFRGNPYLRPEYSHNLAATVNYHKWSWVLSYTFTKDKINTIIEIKDLNEPAIFDFKRDNILSADLLSLSISYPLQLKWFSSYNTLIFRNENHKYLDQGKWVNNSIPGLYFSTNNSFHLPSGWSLELNFWYTTRRVDGLYTDNPLSMLNLALSRKFLQDHLTVSLLGNDIFDQYKFRGVASIYGNAWTYLSAGDFQYVMLSLKWDFGKMNTSQLQGGNMLRKELNRIQRQ